MSGTASITNTFQSRTGNIPLSDLDLNFTNLVDYANDPTNRNNYASATGPANTYTVALSPAALGYTAGLEIAFKTANANTGASTLNVNGLGSKSIVTPGGAALSANMIQSIAKVLYDGTNFVLVSANTSGGGVDHGGLTGLADDDHTQYLLAATTGDRTTFTAVWANITGGSTATAHVHDHGVMVGLGDDDHTQYLLASGGRALAGDWNAADNQVAAPKFKDYSVTRVVYTQTAATITFDYSLANYHECTLTQNVTAVAITNPPASGTYGEVVVRFTQAATATFTIAYGASFLFPAGTDHQITATTSAVDMVSFKTSNAGTAWFCDFSKGYA